MAEEKSYKTKNMEFDARFAVVKHRLNGQVTVSQRLERAKNSTQLIFGDYSRQANG